MAGKSDKKLLLITVSPEEAERQKLLREALCAILPGPEAERAAASLLERFGNFEGVFAAPEEELALAPGISRETARFLKLTTELSRAYLEDKSRDLKRIYDTDSAAEVFRPKFLGRRTEAVSLMLLDGRGRLIYHGILSEGAVSAVPIYVRRLVYLCIVYDAQNVMLAHNHPSGSAAPSSNDIVATRQVEMALQSIDASLSDHIIFAGNDYYSFAKSGMLDLQKETVRKYRLKKLQEGRGKERELSGGKD